MTAAQQAQLGRRLSVIEVKLAQVWARLTALPADRADSDQVIGLVEQYELCSDRRVELRRACEQPA
jgi:hypothetical protein